MNAHVTLTLITMSMFAVFGCDSDKRKPSFNSDQDDQGERSIPRDMGGINSSRDSSILMDMNTPRQMCTVQWRYAPEISDELYAFPDDYYRTPPTNGARAFLNITPDTAPWLDELPDLAAPSFENLNELDGYGLNAGIFLRFSAPISEPPSGAEESMNSDALIFVEINAEEELIRVPYQARLGEDGHDLYLRPLAPLKEGSQHAVIMTDDYLSAEGGCIETAPTFSEMLKGTSEHPDLSRLSRRLETLINWSEETGKSIVAAIQFTTHTHLELLSDIADEIRSRTYAWAEPPTCAPEESWTRCEGLFEASDFRVSKVIQDSESQPRWMIPVTAWMPKDLAEPAPVIVGAHGINSNRGQINGLVRRMVPLGYAVIAIDAIEHGDHPSREEGDTGLDALRILGINLAERFIDIRATRGNFNQTTLDRLQLIQLIRDDPDVNFDGVPDLDINQVGYFGISLGAIMGPSLIALSHEIKVAVLAVGGGDLLQFALGNPTIVPLLPLLAQLAGSQGILDRTILAGQALLDSADPNTYATRIFKNRLGGGEHTPNLLLSLSTFDQVVPPENGHSLARAIALPHVPPVLDPIELLVPSGDTPIQGNLNDETTIGVFQYDRVTSGDQVIPSDHDNTPYSPEATLQLIEFFESWRSEGVSRIIDPYQALNTPPL